MASGMLAVVAALRSLRYAGQRAWRVPLAKGAGSQSLASRQLSERVKRVYDYPKDRDGDILTRDLGDQEARKEEEEMEAAEEVPGDAKELVTDEILELKMSKVLEEQLAARSAELEQHR